VLAQFEKIKDDKEMKVGIEPKSRFHVSSHSPSNVVISASFTF